MRHIQTMIGGDGGKFVPNSFAPRKPKAREDSPLPTVRSDLVKIREALLKGDDKDALSLTDHTLDCIDEYIIEGGLV